MLAASLPEIIYKACKFKADLQRAKGWNPLLSASLKPDDWMSLTENPWAHPQTPHFVGQQRLSLGLHCPKPRKKSPPSSCSHRPSPSLQDLLPQRLPPTPRHSVQNQNGLDRRSQVLSSHNTWLTDISSILSPTESKILIQILTNGYSRGGCNLCWFWLKSKLKCVVCQMPKDFPTLNFIANHFFLYLIGCHLSTDTVLQHCVAELSVTAL